MKDINPFAVLGVCIVMGCVGAYATTVRVGRLEERAQYTKGKLAYLEARLAALEHARAQTLLDALPAKSEPPNVTLPLK